MMLNRVLRGVVHDFVGEGESLLDLYCGNGNFSLGLAEEREVVGFDHNAASVGAAAIPSAGLVMIFVVLRAIGLDTPQAATIVGFMLAIDRPLDMLRTATNVYSDSAGAAIVAKSEGEKGIDE